MTISVSSKTVKYAGIQPVEFHTYTQVYPSFNGANWQFNPNALNPMEFWGFINGDNPVGIYANLIDVTTGYTTVRAGDNTVASKDTNNVFTQPAWQTNRLHGWCFGSVLARNSYLYDIGAAFSHGYTTPVFSPVNGNSLVAGPNNFTPQSGAAPNIPTPNDGVSSSFVLALAPTYEVAIGTSFNTSGGTLDLGISNTFQMINGMPFSGTTWVQAHNPGSNTDRHQLLQTDFLTFGMQYLITFENPSGGPNIDTLMTQQGNHGSSTYQGFLYIDKSTIVVEGKTLNGFGILVAPDYSSYRIIQLVPRDGTAAAWTSAPGDYTAKIDASGALWLKNFNSSNTLFVSSGSLLRTLPIFPPLPIPGGTDYDTTLRMMRATNIT